MYFFCMQRSKSEHPSLLLLNCMNKIDSQHVSVVFVCLHTKVAAYDVRKFSAVQVCLYKIAGKFCL